LDYNQQTNNRVLVLVDSLTIRSTHSQFLADLAAKGLVVDVHLVSSTAIKLKDFGEYLYDHIVLLCTSENESKILGV